MKNIVILGASGSIGVQTLDVITQHSDELVCLGKETGIYDYGPYWLWVALSVSTSLLFIVLWGTLSGSLIPFLLRKMKLDPAAASAPFVATLVDVTGLIIYFSVSALFLAGKLL